MKKQIFKVGDTVYCKIYGKGRVITDVTPEVQYDKHDNYSCRKIAVEFEIGYTYTYLSDGRINEWSEICLSFTPWTEKPNLERPIDYTEWIGKVCAFWDEEMIGVFIDVLTNYTNESTYRFTTSSRGKYKFCQLLDDKDFVNKIKNK